ncbi:MAG: AMP-binding protein [Actinobacteria bacterium]|nr:AMP-binding protein [Actinomycetota bacterium]MCG2817968.1 AMP-binding protein [Actinomycetes bacterium]MBU4179446.1 AMP-binding protein [Actinomycetota bacterium]MBU4219436.1 AMP-binding protein [Actinomycetota bacterium]MBU4358273.1 AMP-binding protein [Actinomycetota bacterium]
MARELYSGRWDRMSFDEQREYRNRKLSYFVRTELYPYCTYYRKVFDDNKVKPEDIRTVEDLRKLPFTYKSDIAPDTDNPDRFREFVLQPDKELMEKYMPRFQLARLKMDRVFKGEEYVKRSVSRKFLPVHMQFTTGRTGLPTPIMYAAYDVERMAEGGRRIMELAGFGTVISHEEARVVNAMPFAPHLGFWMVEKGLDKTGVLSLHTGGGRILGTQRIIFSVEGMKATSIVGMPGYVYRVLKTAAEQESDFSSIKVVLVAGDRISGGMKKKMGELLESMGARDFHVLGAYGFTEARKSYSECVPDGDTGYHVFPDMDYIEIVDPATGEPVDDGEDGELVYTCLEGQGTSVVRFRTGDVVKGGIVYEPCPSCGRTVPRLGSEISRPGGMQGFSLTKLKGTLVDQGTFFTVLKSNPNVTDWQIEISKAGDDPYDMDVVDVYIAPSEGADPDTLRDEIEAALHLCTEVKPNAIKFLSQGELVERLRGEGGVKEIRVVDRRPDI